MFGHSLWKTCEWFRKFQFQVSLKVLLLPVLQIAVTPIIKLVALTTSQLIALALITNISL